MSMTPFWLFVGAVLVFAAAWFAPLPHPRIGTPRVEVNGRMTLYPGEVAHAMVPLDYAKLVSTGQSIRITKFLVEPIPGWYGVWLRAKWRLAGRWLARLGFGAPDIRVDAKLTEEREP